MTEPLNHPSFVKVTSDVTRNEDEDMLALWEKLWPRNAQEPALSSIGRLSEVCAILDLVGNPESRISAWYDVHEPSQNDIVNARQAAERSCAEYPGDIDTDNFDLESITFIDLNKHPEFAVGKVSELLEDTGTLSGKCDFIVRREYQALAKAIFADWPWHAGRQNILPANSKRKNFFWTGQPGKSFGMYYLLYLVLSLGIPIMAQLSATTIYHFSSHGVWVWKGSTFISDGNFREVCRDSWALFDVDKQDWYPDAEGWARYPQIFVWASSPNPKRQHELKHLPAPHLIWNIAQWSLSELVLASRSRALPLDVLFARIIILGQIPRDLFDKFIAFPEDDYESLRQQVVEAMVNIKTVLATLRGSKHSETSPTITHQLFLIQPKRTETEGEAYIGSSFSWRSYTTVSFRSPAVTRIVSAELERAQLETLITWQELFFSYTDHFASVAGWLLEQAIHVLLTEPEAILRGSNITRVLNDPLPSDSAPVAMISGVGLETFKLHLPNDSNTVPDPLYIRARDATFPLIDSAFLADGCLILIQVTRSSDHVFNVAALAFILHRLQTFGVAFDRLHFALFGEERDRALAATSKIRKIRDDAFTPTATVPPQLSPIRRKRTGGSDKTIMPVTHPSTLDHEQWGRVEKAIKAMSFSTYQWERMTRTLHPIEQQ